MNAKITKQRLSHLLSYDWLKIIATIVGIILFWELIFTMSATRILSSQQFGIYNYIGSSITQRFNEYANSADSFSHELIQISVEDLTAGGNEYVYTLAESRLATNEADVVFAPDIEGNNLVQYKKEINGELINATCLEDFLYRYSQYVYQLDGEKGYFKQMENYLNGYYNGDYKTDCEFFTDVLIKNGVPAQAIVGEDKSGHTRDNAFLSKKVVDESGVEIKTALIVCKAFHARRCLMLYQMAFPNVKIKVCPVHCFNITKDNWYMTEQGIDRVLGELARCGNQFVGDVKNYLSLMHNR